MSSSSGALTSRMCLASVVKVRILASRLQIATSVSSCPPFRITGTLFDTPPLTSTPAPATKANCNFRMQSLHSIIRTLRRIGTQGVHTSPASSRTFTVDPRKLIWHFIRRDSGLALGILNTNSPVRQNDIFERKSIIIRDFKATLLRYLTWRKRLEYLHIV